MIHRPYPSLPAFSLADKKKTSIEGLKRPLSTKQGDQSSGKMEEYTFNVMTAAVATIEQATHAYYLTVVVFSFFSLLSFSAGRVASCRRSRSLIALRCAFIGPLSSAH